MQGKTMSSDAASLKKIHNVYFIYLHINLFVEADRIKLNKEEKLLIEIQTKILLTIFV
jgi:hypothetical protein